MKEYWNEQITDICENVMFKFKQTNPIDLINLVTESMNYETANLKAKQEFISQCLSQVIWTKDGTNWFPLIDVEGNPRLPEFKEKPAIGFDLFNMFRRDVVYPVFTESKTYQNLISASMETKSDKK